MIVNNQRQLEQFPLVLTVGQTSGQQVFYLSSESSYIAISNPTVASVSFGVGQLAVPTADSVTIIPHTNYSGEIQNTNSITVF